MFLPGSHLLAFGTGAEKLQFVGKLLKSGLLSQFFLQSMDRAVHLDSPDIPTRRADQIIIMLAG
jgi:hypothetical protein